MAARLECRYRGVNQKSRQKSRNCGAFLGVLKVDRGTFEDIGESCAVVVRIGRLHRPQATVHGMSEREKSLTVNDLYQSIQCESTWVGRRCVFVRLTFCNLRCNYCDTDYAFYDGKKRTLGEILDAVAAFRCPLVEITGGEPLLQKNVLPLMSMLCELGYEVLLETSAACDISKVDPRRPRIMDLNTTLIGEVDKNVWSNIDHLTMRDEVKVVMGCREDD